MFSLWQEQLRKQIVNLSSINLWIFLALTRALGVAGRLDLFSVMTSSWYYLAVFFILSFIWSPTYGQENIHLFHLQLMDWRLIHFLFSPIFTRPQRGETPNCFFLITIIFRLTMPHIYVSDFRACILAIFWLISLEEHFVEFRVLTVDTYDCPPCTWDEAFLSNPWTWELHHPWTVWLFLSLLRHLQ